MIERIWHVVQRVATMLFLAGLLFVSSPVGPMVFVVFGLVGLVTSFADMPPRKQVQSTESEHPEGRISHA